MADKQLKPWLVDVPVRINIWIRPECQRKQFEIIKKARPRILFITSDGGRNEKEWKLINKNREMYDSEIDWECKVFKLYEDVNNGMYTMMEKRNELVWKNVDRCICLEDDVLPSVSFFKYCAELLEKYKDDLRIHYISGMNYEGVSTDVEADYFFSGESSIWGFAIWKRTYEEFNLNYANSQYYTRVITEMAKQEKKGYEKLILGYAKNGSFNGHIPGTEFYKNYLRFAQNQICIVPKYNLISNIGTVEGSTHSADKINKLPKSVQRLFNMQRYEMTFPMKHPEYIVRDLKYESVANKLTCWNHPILKLTRKIERFYRCLIFGDLKNIRRGFVRILKHTKEK